MGLFFGCCWVFCEVRRGEEGEVCWFFLGVVVVVFGFVVGFWGCCWFLVFFFFERFSFFFFFSK